MHDQDLTRQHIQSNPAKPFYPVMIITSCLPFSSMQPSRWARSTPGPGRENPIILLIQRHFLLSRSIKSDSCRPERLCLTSGLPIPAMSSYLFSSLCIKGDLIASYIMRPICSVSFNFKLIKSR